MARYKNVELAKQEAAAIKRDVLLNWDNYLVEFEEKIAARGVEVLWANDAEEATAYIKQILKDNEARLLVKSKSMTTEEIELNHVAESVGCESVETDLGEFIVQVAGERPYHIVNAGNAQIQRRHCKAFQRKVQYAQ